MEIGANGSLSSASGVGGSLAGNNIAETFDNFLVLLTTQLQNQDPLSPLDSTQFTEQLVSFTGVEQQINTNRKLDQLLSLQAMNQTATAVDYIGKTIRANGNQVMLQDGAAEFSYELAGNAAETEILIVDQQGETVRTIQGSRDAGEQTYQWDGLDDDGEALQDGIYNVQVRATNAEGATVSSTVYVSGRVTGVEAGANGLNLLIGELPIALQNVIAVRETPQAEG